MARAVVIAVATMGAAAAATAAHAQAARPGGSDKKSVYQSSNAPGPQAASRKSGARAWTLDLETGAELASGAEFHGGRQVLGALTIEANDFGDTHDPTRRIALRGSTYSDGLGEVSITVAYAQAESRGEVGVGAVGLEPITAEFQDYQKVSIEAGLRRYVGPDRIGVNGSLVRTFVSGTVGFAHLRGIDTVLRSAGFPGLGPLAGFGDLPPPETIEAEFYDDSIVPTVSAAFGAQWRVTPRLALEAEAGVRYDGAPDENDDDLQALGIETVNDVAGRVSYPVMLRGRYTFGEPSHRARARALWTPDREDMSPYLNIGATQVSIDDSNADLWAVTFRPGVRLHPNFALEGEISTGVSGESETVGGVTATADQGLSGGVFARGLLPLGERATAFGRVGYALTTLEASLSDGVTTIETRETEGGVAFGGGFEARIRGGTGVRAEYTRIQFDEGGSADTATISLVQSLDGLTVPGRVGSGLADTLAVWR